MTSNNIKIMNKDINTVNYFNGATKKCQLKC